MRRTLLLFSLLALFPASSRAYDSVQLKKSISTPPNFKAFAPTSVVIDGGGRLWVTDTANDQLLQFSPSNDAVLAIGKHGSAPGEFIEPHGVALDAEGFVYVADKGNNRVQVFSPDGKFHAAFGVRGNDPGQFHNPWTLAVSQDGVVVVGEKDGTRLQLFSKDGVFFRAFDIGSPIDGLAVDAAGRLYTAHLKLRQIEQWSSVGQLMRTFTGNEPGVKPFSKPQNLAVSPTGLLYVTDRANGQFRELDATGHTIGTFGRSGSGEGQFRSLDGIAVQGDDVVVCDSKNSRMTILSLSRQTPLPALTPVAAARIQVGLQAPLALDADRLATNPDGTLDALSISRGEIAFYNLAAGTVTFRIDVKKQLGVRTPAGIATAPSSGSLFIADADRVIKIDKQGKLLQEFGKSSKFFKSGQGDLSKPQGLTCTPQGVLFVADTGNSRFQAYNHQGLFQFAAGEKGWDAGQLQTPMSIAWDKERLYVADTGKRKIVTFSASGRYLHETGSDGPDPLSEPRQVAVDREGNLYVLDSARGRIIVYDPQGLYVGGFGGLGKEPGFLNHPRGFALNDSGDLYMAEEGRVQVFHVLLLPPAPTGLSATAGEGYVSLRWDPVKTRFPSRYVVYRRSPQGETQRVKETVETTATDDSLTANTTYSYTVVAQSVQGAASVPSAPVLAAAKILTSGPRLEILSAEIEDIFSAHYKYYGRVPFGHVTIRNNGPSPVQKIKLSFAIQGYMDYPTEIAIPELHSLQEKEVPLVATFNNRILEVSETTPIQAQLRVSYYNGDQESVVVRNLPFKLYSRNTIRWDKKERLAAFVTPNDPPIIDFARGVAIPFGEAHRGAPVPASLLTAWSIFEGLGTYGIVYVPRPNNPYDRVSLDSSTVDSLQFARETLARKSGDCADVVALLASALESMTVTTCALDAPGHLFLMFDTGETRKEALDFPDGWLVPYAGTYWIPVEATMLGSSFLDAWKQGAEEYRRWSQKGQVTPVDIHLAWRTFEPATLPEIASGAKAPSREEIEQKFLPDWKALVDLRWQTGVATGKEAAEAAPASGQPWLELGFLAMDFRHYEEAKGYFTKALKDPATAAAGYNDLGNLAFIQGDTAQAETQYKQALEKDSADAQIDLNLTRVYLKQGLPQKASAAFDRAMALDASLREQYPDVSSLTP